MEAGFPAPLLVHIAASSFGDTDSCRNRAIIHSLLV